MLAGCAHPDDGGTVVVSTPVRQLQECDQTVYLTNQSSQPLTLTAGLSDDDGTADCVDQAQDTNATVVSPGTAQQVDVALQCYSCDLRAYYTVNSTDPNSSILLHYDQTLGGGNITCNDAGCIGR